MLVFQKNFHPHVLKLRLPERVGENRERWLIAIVAEINRFLPDDWLMTRSGNNFRIQVVSTRGNCALVGHSFKINDGKGVLSIIDTIFAKGFFDSEDIRIVNKDKDFISVDRNVKARHSEIMIPNLYFFQPCPDDSLSPLFARQSERIKLDEKNNPVGTQYHRIHPLTRSGLDFEHFRWVKWDIIGNIDLIDYPDKGYHGKDYWVIPDLKDQPDRDNSEDNYIEQYEKIISEHLVAEPERKEGFFPAPYEREVKFSFKGDIGAFNKLIPKIEEKIKESGFSVIWEKPKEQRDIYFDDDNFSLYASGASFRHRKKKGNARITLKKRYPQISCKTEVDRGLYLRMEEETTISEDQELALLEGDRINVFPYRLIAYVAPECGQLKQVVKLINRRTVGIVASSEEGFQRIELCHDIVTYCIGEKEYGPFYEVELESKGAENKFVDHIASFFMDESGIEFSENTKYEKGVMLLKSL